MRCPEADDEDEERVRFVLDDETMDRLRAGAASRKLSVEELLQLLVDRASRHLDTLLDPPS